MKMSKKTFVLAKKVLDLWVVLMMLLQPVSMPGVMVALAQEAENSTVENVTVPEIEQPKVETQDKVSQPKQEETVSLPKEEIVASKVVESVDQEKETIVSSGSAVEDQIKSQEKNDQVDNQSSEGKIDPQAASIVKSSEVWSKDGDKAATNDPVDLGKTYVAPQNDQVSVTFTKLPEKSGKLSIEEITLSDKQVATLHALSSKAYDITSDMADGTFAYDLTLPKPKDQDVKIKFAEDKSGLENADAVSTGDVEIKTDSVSASLDHFTIFVVTAVFDSSDGSVRQIVNASENPKLRSSDNSRLESDGQWTTSNYSDGRYIEFDFNPGLPLEASINGNVELNFEYQRESLALFDNNYKARLLIYNPETSTWDILNSDIRIDNPNEDKLFKIAIPGKYADTSAKVNNLKIRFQAVGKRFIGNITGNGIKTYHDYVALDFSYKPAAPALVSPENGIYRHSANTNKSDWSDVLGVSGSSISYKYQSSRDTSFSALLYDSKPLTASEIYNPGEPEGKYFWRVQACDTNLNCSDWGGPWEINVDNNAPSVPTNGLPNASYKTTNDFYFTWDASTDESGLPVTYEFQSSGSSNVDANGSLTNSWNSIINGNAEQKHLTSPTIHSIGAPDGTWYWQVRAIDAAGNVSAWSPVWNMTIDTKAPAVPTGIYFKDTVNNKDVQCGGFTSARNFDVYWDKNTEADFDHYEYTSYNSDGNVGLLNKPFDEPYFNASWWLVPNEGTYGVQLRAVDKAGNVSAWSGGVQGYASSCKYTSDWSAPTVDLEFPTPGSNAKTFQAKFSEAVNKSEAENPANYFLRNWPGAGGSGDLNGHANISYDQATRIATVTFTTDGWYVSPEQEWGVQNIHDLAGNTLSVNPYSETSTPMVAPVTTDSGTDSNWHKLDVTVNFSCADVSGSGCKSTYFTTDGSNPTTSSASGNSVTLNTDGIFTIKYFSVDNAGNVESVKTAANAVKIDKTAPSSPSLLSPSNNAFVKGFPSLTNSWSNVSDARKYIYESYHDAAATSLRYREEYTKTSKTATNVADAIFWWRVKAVDQAGNESGWSDLWKVTVDNTAPIISIKNPNSEFAQSKTIKASTNEGVLKMFVNASGVTTCGATLSFEDYANTTFSSEEDNGKTVCYQATDEAGNVAYKLSGAIVGIDLTLPTSAITSPSNSGTNSLVYSNSWDGTISGTASDDESGVAGVKLSIQNDSDEYWNGSSWTGSEGEVLVDAIGAESWTYKVGLITEGSYQIRSHAVDKAGNIENTYSINIIFDKTIPEVSLSISPKNPDGDNDWYATKPQITLAANDNILLDKIEYQLNGVSGAWLSYSAPVTIADGTWKFYYRSVDKAGNFSGIGLKNVKVDTINPDSVDKLGAKYESVGKFVKLSWKAPKDSDIDKVLIYRGTSKDFTKDSGSLVSKQNRIDESFVDKHADSGETYYYKVVSQDEAGNKSDSVIIKIEIPTDGRSAAGVLQGTEPSQTQTGNNDAVGDVKVSGSTGDGQGGSVLGESTSGQNINQATGFWGSNWKWLLLLLVIGAGFFVWKRRKQAKVEVIN